MMYALVNGQKEEPTPNARGVCPQCGGGVQAKCGFFNTWHWAHNANECDPWSEPESDWHKRWKARFPQEQTEVVIDNHRADIRTNTGYIIELQHSPINVEKIQEREAFYGEKMVWVIDGAPFQGYFQNYSFIRDADSRRVEVFTWQHRQKRWWYAQRPVFIDRSSSLFYITQFFPKAQPLPKGTQTINVHGLGDTISIDTFMERFNT